MNERGRWLLTTLLLSVLLLASAVAALMCGPAEVTPQQIIDVLRGNIGAGHIVYDILIQIRIPRILLGLAVGGALATAGVILQGMFRNPLVEPYTLGISGGAALGVCLIIVLKLTALLGPLTIPLAGFLGAIAVVAVVYWLAGRREAFDVQGLLLSGVMISYICSSLFMLLMALVRAEDLHGIVFWIMGSLEQPQELLIRIMCFVALAGLGGAYFFCKELNAFSLGEEQAKHLGVDAERTKRTLFILASGLTGASVAVAGIIGFVGLVVPHLMRLIVGANHRNLLIASFLAGGIFLINCDTLARIVIAPLELPVGVITGIIGGSVFVYALSRRQGAFDAER